MRDVSIALAVLIAISAGLIAIGVACWLEVAAGESEEESDT